MQNHKLEDQRYHALAEEVNAITIELRKTERETPIHRLYLTGEAIRKAVGEANITAIVNRLAQDTKCSTRHLWKSVEFYDHFPYESLIDVPDNVTCTDIFRMIRNEDKQETVIKPEEFALKTLSRWQKKYGKEQTEEIITHLNEHYQRIQNESVVGDGSLHTAER